MKPNLDTMLAQHNEQISAVVTQHLNLEALLEELLKRHLANPDALDFERMMFAQKLSLCRAIGVITKEVFEQLKKLNALRNKFAHKLGFSPPFEDILALAKMAGEAGIEFSDGVDALSVEGAKELGYDEYTLLEK